MTFGEVLHALAEWVYEFWPVRIVQPWEQGIRLFAGRATALLEPGLHWFVPKVGEIITADVLTDVNATATQTCTTEDGATVSFELSLRFRISNLLLMYTSIQDHESTITTLACSAAAQRVTELPVQQVAEHLGPDVFAAVHRQLEEWGVELEDVSLFSFTECRAYRLIMGEQ